MDSDTGIVVLAPVRRRDIFLTAFDHIPNPRADNARYTFCELLVLVFVAKLCGAANCAGLADFSRRQKSIFSETS
jgi:hypothetical protein